MRELYTAVITGPTGAVGNALVSVLLQNNITVYAVVRPESARNRFLGEANTEAERKNLHLVPCELSDYDSLPERIPSGADAFFHLAWAATTGAGRNDMDAQIENIRASVHAVRAAAKLGCRVFVGAGSQAEYGRFEGKLCPDTPCFPENGYGMAKLCAGEMTRVECAKFELDHIWMRILSVYGPNDGEKSLIMTLIRKFLAGETPAVTKGEQKWDYLYSGDAGRALYLAARNGRNGAVYPLGSGCARPLREYIETVRDAVDPGLPVGFGEVPYAEKQVMYLEADISALREDCGFAPEVSFAKGIQNTIEWVKQHG